METRQESLEQNETTLLDLLVILAKRKRFIIVGTLCFALITAVLGFTMDSVFQGNARILVPQSTSSTSALLTQIAGASAAGMITGMMGIGTSADMYVGILKSRTVLDTIIDRFDLVNVYKADRFLGDWRSFTRDGARLVLANALSTEISTDGNIVTLAVRDKDAKRSAEMANAFVQELIKRVQNLAMTEAARRRIFYEDQLKKAFASLSKAEESVKGFQEASGAFQIDEQAKAVLMGIATLEAQVAAKEIQIKVMKTYATQQNPDLIRLQRELDGLKEQRKKLEERGDSSATNPIIPTGSIPTLGTDYLRKMREFKYQEALYLLLLKQYEAARLDEARDSTIIQVVDEAVTPEIRVWPKPILMTIAGILVGFILSVFAAFLMEHQERSMQDAAGKERWETLKIYLKRI